LQDILKMFSWEQRHLELMSSQNCEKRLLDSYACISVRPYVTTWLPQDGFSWNLVFEYLSQICRENSSFIKLWL